MKRFLHHALRGGDCHDPRDFAHALRHAVIERGFGGRGFGGGFGSGFGRGGMGRGERGFGHGGLRLVILKLIEEKPSHGYELIKAIEERFKGAYSPSPGVVYPTLNWLEDEGFITVTPDEDGRKSAHITEAGQAHLAEKAAQVEALFNLMNGDGHPRQDYAPLFRAMGNLQETLRTRGLMSKDEINGVVDLIDELAKKIERL